MVALKGIAEDALEGGKAAIGMANHQADNTNSTPSSGQGSKVLDIAKGIGIGVVNDVLKAVSNMPNCTLCTPADRHSFHDLTGKDIEIDTSKANNEVEFGTKLSGAAEVLIPGPAGKEKAAATLVEDAVKLAESAAKEAESLAAKTELLPEKIFSSKAPKQVTPGTKTLEGQYINDKGRVEPWTAHYDEYGRQVGRTDFNAGNKAQGIPDTHYHTYEYGPGTPGGMETGSHLPGEY